MLAARPAGRWEVDWLAGRPAVKLQNLQLAVPVASLSLSLSLSLSQNGKVQAAARRRKSESGIGCGVWGVSQFAQSFMHYLFIDTFASRAIAALPFRRLDTVARQFARFGHG